MRKLPDLLLALSLVVVLPLSVASAQYTANIDFGRNNNQTAGYNNVGHAASGNVLNGDTYSIFDTTGAGTGISLIVNPDAAMGGPANGSYAGAGADYTGAVPSIFSGIASSALTDSIFIRNQNGNPADPLDTTATRVEFELTGLNAGFTYDLLIYGSRGNNGGVTSYFASDDGGTTYSGQSFNIFNNSTGFAQFTGLSGSSSISLVATTPGDPGLQGAINFMQITASAVPEPTSAGLLLIAGVSCVLRRRR